MISVCMATYNGEKYIKEQLDSIIRNLTVNDEIVVSDDGSTDKTRMIVKDYICNSHININLVEGPGKGVKANFENAISLAKGDIIFLADQDDVWRTNKVKRVMEEFDNDKEVMVVLHDADVFKIENGKRVRIMPSFMAFRKAGTGKVRNIIKNSYIGCCMAFRKEMVQYILPIPDDIEMHDQWIGILCESKGKSVMIDEVLLHYRRHEDNESALTRNPVPTMIKNKTVLSKELLERRKEIRKNEK